MIRIVVIREGSGDLTVARKDGDMGIKIGKVWLYSYISPHKSIITFYASSFYRYHPFYPRL